VIVVVDRENFPPVTLDGQLHDVYDRANAGAVLLKGVTESTACRRPTLHETVDCPVPGPRDSLHRDRGGWAIMGPPHWL
jgi:hypothetical protein